MTMLLKRMKERSSSEVIVQRRQVESSPVKQIDRATQEFIDNCESWILFGGECRRRRIEWGYQANDVAWRMGVSPSLIHQIENGLLAPSPKRLDQLADFFGFPREFVRIVAFMRDVETKKAKLGLSHLGVSIDWSTTTSFRRNV